MSRQDWKELQNCMTKRQRQAVGFWKTSYYCLLFVLALKFVLPLKHMQRLEASRGAVCVIGDCVFLSLEVKSWSFRLAVGCKPKVSVIKFSGMTNSLLLISDDYECRLIFRPCVFSAVLWHFNRLKTLSRHCIRTYIMSRGSSPRREI